MQATIRSAFGACGVVALFLCAHSAVASPMTYDITFGATDFTLQSGSGAPPINFVLGHFSVTLDPAVSSDGPISLGFIQVPFDPPAIYQYTQVAREKLIIGGTAGGTDGLVGNDFSMGVGDLGSGTPHFLFVFYSTLDPFGAQSIFLSTHGDIQVTEAPATTPLPPALPLFVSALGGLGWLGYRHKRLTA
jgi:hypothetical protein